MEDQDDCSGKRDDHFRALYEQGYPAVLRYAARRVGPEDARDIAAETFIIAWRRLDRVPVHEPLPWLYATARRCLANELRSRGRRDRLDARVRAEASAGTGAAHEGVADGFAGGLAERLDVLTALATLRPNDQETLRLTEWEQLDDATAAQVAGCSTTAFKVRLHRARRRLARALARQAEAPGRGLSDQGLALRAPRVLDAAPVATPATSPTASRTEQR